MASVVSFRRPRFTGVLPRPTKERKDPSYVFLRRPRFIVFMNQADETQANLAFVALRQEPFLVEEFDYLANQIQDLHEVRVEA